MRTANFFGPLFPAEGFIELRALPSAARTFAAPHDAGTFQRFLNSLRDQNLYFGVAARRDATSGGVENCGPLAALFVDLDFKSLSEAETRAQLEAFPLPPSAIVASGGGLHVYWLLCEPLDLQAEASRARDLLRRLARHLGGDMRAAEPARILRIPGTFNYKYNPPRPVQLERFEPERRYNPTEFEWLLPVEPTDNGQGERFALPETIREGERNDTLYRLARSLKARGLTPEGILAALEAENRARCEPPLPPEEVREIAEHAMTQADRPAFTATEGATRTCETESSAGPYRVLDGHIVREKQTQHGVITEPLCNFVATVTEELVLDDGVETSRAFVVEGQLNTGERLPLVRVPTTRFGGMNWVTESWGLRAVVRAGQATRDYLREAIQRLSPRARERRVFTHTGWREVEGEWVYLTAGGAVGREGFEVDLGPELARYCLPRDPEDPVEAMRVSLRLLRLAPLRVTVPLWAAVYRAPLASAHPVDCSLWVEGQSGALKSTLGGVFLAHFGDFDRTHLPGAWSSTANQLERRAFILKDVLFVVDDYAPSALDARELEAKAARLLRAQGNLSGRGRLRADLSDRPAFPPRGLIVSTGEQHPPGQSLLARMVLVELERADVDLAALTEAQRVAPRLPHAVAGYVGWLAPQMPTLPGLLHQTFAGARALATADGEHLRVPEALAHLWLGLHSSLSYAEEIGACSRAEAEQLRTEGWAALLTLGRAQGRLVEEERPSRRFLAVLLTLVSQRRAVLLPKEEDGDGLRAGVDLLGWQDDEGLYLLPEAACQAVARFCREAGEPFPVRQERLKRDLAKEGLTECDPGRHTAVAWLGGRSRRVLKLKRRAVEALLGEQFPTTLPGLTTLTGFGGERGDGV